MLETEIICKHEKLTKLDDFGGVEVNVERPVFNRTHSESRVTGMFIWKKYACDNCGKIITILNAVIEEAE